MACDEADAWRGHEFTAGKQARWVISRAEPLSQIPDPIEPELLRHVVGDLRALVCEQIDQQFHDLGNLTALPYQKHVPLHFIVSQRSEYDAGDRGFGEVLRLDSNDAFRNEARETLRQA